jgi:hypothetical protein
MSSFGPIAYEDLSHLNAEWQEERPPMAGLGALADMAQHEYVDVSFLNARLRPIIPKGVNDWMGIGTGNGVLSGNSIGVVAGLGEDPSYPWAEYSADTKALQEETNQALIANGYAPITADGKLGKATCGAIRAMCATISPQCDAPATCQGFEAPTKAGLLSKGTTRSTSSQASMFGGGGGGGTNWLLIGGAVAAIAIGGALIFKASKK